LSREDYQAYNPQLEHKMIIDKKRTGLKN